MQYMYLYTCIVHVVLSCLTNTCTFYYTVMCCSFVYQVLSKVLSLTTEEVQNVQSQLDNYNQTLSSSQHVRFSEDSSMGVVEFLCCFECEAQRVEASPGEKQPSAFSLHIRGRKDLSDSKSLQLGKFSFDLFTKCSRPWSVVFSLPGKSCSSWSRTCQAMKKILITDQEC